MKWMVAAVVMAALVSGCVSPNAPAPPGADYDALEAEIGFPLENMETAPAAVNLQRINMTAEQAGRTGMPTEGFIESAVKDGYAYICRTGPNQGLVVFDVRDIENPKQVGYLNLEAGFEPDIEVSDDGNWGFWETQRFPTSAQAPDPTNPAGAPGSVLMHGIHIIDLRDKTHPQWVGFTPILPDGPHSITYANITGRHIVFASTYAFAYAYASVAVPDAQRLIILELDTRLPVAQLRTLAEYVDPDYSEPNPAQAKGGQFPHDVTVQQHPLTGDYLAYVSYWDLGVVILNVTHPAAPTKVSAYTDFGPANYREIHMARSFPELIAGRHVTVAEPEIGGQPDTGYLTFFDTSNPALPTYISSWKIPGNTDSKGGSWGPHYFDANFGRVVLASYAAGFWVIDVHDEANLLKPRTVAYSFVQAPPASTVGPSGGLFGAIAFDAWWADEQHIVASESASGLTIFRYTGPTP